MTELTKDFVDLLCNTPKIIQENIEWREQNGSQRFKARVLAPEIGDQLELRGVIGKSKRSFSLLYERVPIRRYCYSWTAHTNSNGDRITEPHKHTWSTDHDDRNAYVPTDIDPTEGVNEQLFSFMKEVNIFLEAFYQNLLVEDQS